MKGHPILFSAPMVRALLAGMKTQTRRVFKQAKGLSLSVCIPDETPGVAELSWLYGDGPGYDVHESIKRVPCPYGQPGDRLWVREAWAAPHQYDGHRPADIPALTRWHYAATENLGGLRGRPSIHMPRAASRITLEVTGVRVERLQDISEADALAEGVAIPPTPAEYRDACGELVLPSRRTAREAYRVLWEQINGPESWVANPWVWAVSFRRVP